MLYSISLAKKEPFHSEYLNEDIIDLLGGTFEVPDTYHCDVVPVTSGFEARMDLISHEVYGDELYADIVHRINGPANPLEVNEEQYIVLPGLDHLNDFHKLPAEEWSEAKQAVAAARPKPKTKNQKRKPNEAILGDKRFNIDPQSKIIVY